MLNNKNLLFIFLFIPLASRINAQVPAHDHVIILVMENKSYDSIIGSWQAPYINQLASDTNAALFSQSFALTHPSQPNYFMLFSGSNQNMLTDDTPPSFMLPFSAPNLGAELISSGKKFIGYSENLPGTGYSGDSVKPWVRKHCPWINWQSSSGGTNTLFPTVNLPFSMFPSVYDSLPDVCMVVPDLNDDMHDSSIAKGDNWIKNNLDPLIQWTKTNNSLFILTFDEDDALGTNHITTTFIGQNVLAGQYSEHIDHYSILRTVEDMFGLAYLGATSGYTPITDCWKNSAVSDLTQENYVYLYPNPSKGKFYTSASNLRIITTEIYNTIGEKIFSTSSSSFDISEKPDGIYFARLISEKGIINKKIILQKN